MKQFVHFLLFAILVVLSIKVVAQQEYNKIVVTDTVVKKATKKYVDGTFWGTHVVNLQSTEKVAPGTLQFMIQHRFGPINGGVFQFFGFDQASIRLGLEYGINKLLSVGVGRSNYNKTYDGYVKASLLRQAEGSLPFSVLYFGSIAVNSLHFSDPERVNYFSSRLAFVNQLIIASKVSDRFSFELVPTIVHKNLVLAATDPNDFFAVGFGARYKFSKKMALNVEYIYRIPPRYKTTPAYANYYNSVSVGVDIFTGGHVFQIVLTNSQAMFEAAYITETNQKWTKGGMSLGFNISRDFLLDKKKATTTSW